MLRGYLPASLQNPTCRKPGARYLLLATYSQRRFSACPNPSRKPAQPCYFPTAATLHQGFVYLSIYSQLDWKYWVKSNSSEPNEELAFRDRQVAAQSQEPLWEVSEVCVTCTSHAKRETGKGGVRTQQKQIIYLPNSLGSAENKRNTISNVLVGRRLTAVASRCLLQHSSPEREGWKEHKPVYSRRARELTEGATRRVKPTRLLGWAGQVSICIPGAGTSALNWPF